MPPDDSGQLPADAVASAQPAAAAPAPSTQSAPPADYGISAARAAGYSDADITSYIAQHSSVPIGQAQAAKYSDTEILDHLAAQGAQADQQRNAPQTATGPVAAGSASDMTPTQMYGGGGGSAAQTAPPAQTQAAPAPGTSLDGTSIDPETGAPINLPVPGQDAVNDVAARVGNAVVAGWRDTPDILTPEAQSWLAKAEENNPRPNAQDVLTVGHAVLAAGNAVFRGGLEGISAFGDAVGQPELGRDVAGYYEAMGMHGAPHMPGVLRGTMPETRAILTEQTLAAAKLPQQDAIAAIGAAPDVDGAIAAAAKAVAVPGVSDVATKVADALEEPQAPAGAPAQAAGQPQLGWSEGAPTDLAPSPADDTAPAALDQAPSEQTAEATTANDVAQQAQSVGAAATADLDPGVGDLTPEQALAYRSTAEGQKLLEPQPYGVPDNNAYVKGYVPNEAETSQTVAAARELKTLKTLNPDIANEAASIQVANKDTEQQHFQQVAGSDVDVLNAVATRNAQMEADTQAAWENKSDADTQPVKDVANEILDSRAGVRPLVRTVVNSVVRSLNDRNGSPITDPEILYGVGDHINDLLNENDAGGQKKNAAASSQLMALKDSLYNVIEQAAPGFKQALDNYHQASLKIDEMQALQKFEPKLFSGPNSQMTLSKYQTMMRQIVDARQAPGINSYKSISDDTMGKLWDLRDNLRRSASADNLARTPQSDTAQNAVDIAKATATGGLRTLAAMVPGVGSSIARATAVAQPLMDARAARIRSARGMAMLHPETPPVDLPDQPGPAAPAAAQPVPVRPSTPDDQLQAAPAQTQLEREQAAVAAMKARAQQARSAPAPGQSGNLYSSTTALTPSGNPVAVRYVVREANSLTPSQLPDGRANPKFPQELQPRDRTRAASRAQVSAMANRLRPDLLGYAGDTSTGAPVVGPDGIVESGNGRVMAIKRAYAASGEQAGAYRTWLAGQGFDTSGMQFPVLVRERTAPLDMAARAKLADEMGASPTMAMSAPERAAADARRIPTDMLGIYQSGDVTSPRNAAFVRAFADRAVPAGDRASFMTSDGELSAEGATRVRNALTQRAYGNNALVTALAEDADPNLKAFGGALMDAAGPMAKLRGAIETGEVPPSDDITPAIVGAANVIQTAKRARISLADAVAQGDAFAAPDPMVETILKATFGSELNGRMSRPKLAGLLSNFAAKLQVQSGLFGDKKSATQVFNEAAQEYGHGTDKASN